jgi:transcriptional regulator with XRE-family HTH domain
MEACAMKHHTFGAFIKEKRLALRMTLREFCIENGFDAVNMSRLERGRLRAPQSRQRLEQCARALGIAAESDDWHKLFRLAAAEADMRLWRPVSDEEVVRKLPLLLGRPCGERILEDRLRALVELVRES